MTTRSDVNAAEDAARAHILDIRHPEREGYICIDDDPDDPCAVPMWLWREEDGATSPLCQWHADDRIHEAIPYGSNCSGCGTRHSPLWPDGEPLFNREETNA